MKKYSLTRFWLTYLCVLVPLLGVCFLVTQNLLNRLREEENRKLTNQIEETLNVLNENFVEYRTKAAGLFTYSEFSSSLILNDSYTMWEAVRLLRSLKLFDGTAEEISVYYGEGQLYQSEGLVSPANYFERTLLCDKESIKRGMDALDSEAATIRVLHNEAGKGNLMYHIPIGKDASRYQRSIQIIISFSQVEKMLNSCIQNEELVLQLCFGEDVIYFHNTDKGYRFITERNAEYLLKNYLDSPFEKMCEEPSITVRIWSDEDEQLKDFYSYRNINLILLVVGLFFSVAISFGLSLLRLSQVKKLVNNIVHKNVGLKEKKSWAKNEFDYIQMLLDESIRENTFVRKNVKEYRNNLRQQITMFILHGLLKEREEVQAILNICGTELAEEFFYVCGLNLESQEQAKALEEILQEEYLYYVINENNKNAVFILCEFPDFDFDMHGRSTFAQKISKLFDEIGIDSTIAMSQVYNQMIMVNYGYLEVINILEHVDNKKSKFVCWEGWIQNIEEFNIVFNNEYLSEFQKAIETYDAQLAKEILRQGLKSEHESNGNIRYFNYMIIQALMLNMRIAEDGAVNNQLLYELSSLDLDDERFEKCVFSIIQEYCKNKNNSNEFKRIMKFIEDNYSDCDFSLEKVADLVGCSKPQMSKMFRAQVGTGFVDYVTKIRMEKAKNMLAETTMSIKDIFAAVGYIDLTNASKKFKSYYGVNPSVYREELKNTACSVERRNQNDK